MWRNTALIILDILVLIDTKPLLSDMDKRQCEVAKRMSLEQIHERKSSKDCVK